MGFPLEINNYTAFKALAKGSRYSLYRKIKKAFKPFNIFIFLLHNPEINIEFDDYINSKFPELDMAAGEKTLFFSVIRKNSSLISEFMKSKYFNFKYLYKETIEFFQNQKNCFFKDINSSAYFFTKLLNINFDDLPILIITDDLESSKIHLIKTNENVITEQLTYFGNIARMKENLNLKEFNLSELKIYNIKEVNLDKKISEHLSVFYSTATSLKFENNIFYNEIAKDFNESILNIKNEINISKKNIKTLLSEKKYIDIFSNEVEIFNDNFYDKNILYLSSILLKNKLSEINSHFKTSIGILKHITIGDLELENNIFNKEKALVIFSGKENFKETITEHKPKTIYINNYLLENESKILLNTANTILNIYIEKNPLIDTEFKELDYCPIIIAFVKIFEIEINLSVVHWIRKKLRIHLPMYFNKFEPGVEAELLLKKENRNTIVNFNRGTRSKWLPPGLGQSELSFRELERRFKRSVFYKKYKLNTEFLLKHWKKIRLLRNRAAHTELLNENALLALQNSLNELAYNDIFRKLYLMKNEFRGVKSC